VSFPVKFKADNEATYKGNLLSICFSKKSEFPIVPHQGMFFWTEYGDYEVECVSWEGDLDGNGKFHVHFVTPSEPINLDKRSLQKVIDDYAMDGFALDMESHADKDIVTIILAEQA
jgi:hypothetical protein